MPTPIHARPRRRAPVLLAVVALLSCGAGPTAQGEREPDEVRQRLDALLRRAERLEQAGRGEEARELREAAAERAGATARGDDDWHGVFGHLEHAIVALKRLGMPDRVEHLQAFAKELRADLTRRTEHGAGEGDGARRERRAPDTREREAAERASERERAARERAIQRERTAREQATERERAEHERAAQRERAEREHAIAREHAEREQAAQRERAEHEQATQRQRAEQEQAMQRQRAEREQAEQRRRADREQTEQRRRTDREQTEQRRRTDREPAAERERDAARRQLELYQIARNVMREHGRGDSAELMQRAMRALEVGLEGRDDDEARQIRERAPDVGAMAELMLFSARLLRESNQPDRAAAAEELGRSFQAKARASRGEGERRERAAEPSRPREHGGEDAAQLAELRARLERLKARLAELHEAMRRDGRR